MVSLTRSLSTNWSQTIKLPKSTFPARANVTDQAKYRKKSSELLYAWQSKNRPASDDTFVLHDGPPYANGKLHIGHAVNKILKDIICRIQVQKGKPVHYQPGWDCHGLPIELKALEKWQEQGEVLKLEQQSPVAIRDAARQLAIRTVHNQRGGFQKWGVMGDFENAWLTMDKHFELEQLRVFREMVKKKLIVRRFKPVYWSPSSRTALAEAELEYKEDHESTAVSVKIPLSKFPSLKGKDGKKIEQLCTVIWTTTPWTLPANKAIAVNSKMQYVILEAPIHGNVLVAKPRLQFFKNHIDKTAADNVVLEIPGAKLAGSAFYPGMFGSEGSQLPLLAADFVSPDSGTGLVHCAPGHGMDDYELCRNHDIDAFAPVDNEGKFTDKAWPSRSECLTGKSVLGDGTTAVLDHLSGEGLLLAEQKYEHKYPYDWRSKTPVIIRATEQWFADLGPIRDQALAALDNVRFIPETGKTRLESFVKNRSEWCISRQRAWGVPIPALYHKETGEAVLNDWSVSHIISVVRKHGIEGWWKDDPDDPKWTPLGLRISKGVSMYRRGTDTMDVWFDSGTSWTQMRNAVDSMRVADAPLPQADVYIEGTDQHRGWFQSSLLTHIAFQSTPYKASNPPRAPFKTLITHGFALDKEGRKMSKSLGNVISPNEIIEGELMPRLRNGERDPLGPDALRLFVASSNYTKDITISPEALKSVHANLTRLRITFKLLLGALSDFDPAALQTRFNYTELPTIDRIALFQLSEVHSTVTSVYESFEFYKAITAIAKWVDLDFSSLYLESIKDRLYCDSTDSPSRRSAQSTLWQILRALQSMLAPITPLLVQESLHHALGSRIGSYFRSWSPFKDPYILPKEWSDEAVQNDLKHLLAARSAVRAGQEQARSDRRMASSLMSFVHIGLPDAKTYDFFKKYLENGTLENLFIVSDVSIGHGNGIPEDIRKGQWSVPVDFPVFGNQGTQGRLWVYKPTREKCARCWRHKVEDEEQLMKEEGERLCQRCDDVGKELERERKVEEAGGDYKTVGGMAVNKEEERVTASGSGT